MARPWPAPQGHLGLNPFCQRSTYSWNSADTVEFAE